MSYGCCYCQGYDVVGTFHRLCLYTSDRQIRDTLSRVSDLLTDSQLDALTFVHRLESVYTCQSFETAKHLSLRHSRYLRLRPLFIFFKLECTRRV